MLWCVLIGFCHINMLVMYCRLAEIKTHTHEIYLYAYVYIGFPVTMWYSNTRIASMLWCLMFFEVCWPETNTAVKHTKWTLLNYILPSIRHELNWHIAIKYHLLVSWPHLGWGRGQVITLFHVEWNNASRHWSEDTISNKETVALSQDVSACISLWPHVHQRKVQYESPASMEMINTVKGYVYNGNI